MEAVSRRAVLGGAALAALGGCTAAPGSPPPPTSGAGTHSEPRAAPPPSTTTTTAGPRLPLVLAVHPTRAAPLHATRAVLDQATAGRALSWSELGAPAAGAGVVRGASAGGALSDAEAVAAVQANRDSVAVVRADVLGPGIDAIAVDGVDPLTRPDAYPVTVPAEPESPLDPGRVVTTLWVGDIMLGRRVGQAIAAARDPGLPFRDTADRLRAADLTVGNLECTLSRNGRPTQAGDSFAGDASSLRGVKDAGFDVLVLANNHLGDYGDTALRETVAAVKAAGFAGVGASETLTAALEPAVVERRGCGSGSSRSTPLGRRRRPLRRLPVRSRCGCRHGPAR